MLVIMQEFFHLDLHHPLCYKLDQIFQFFLLKCVPLTISYHLYFLRIAQVLSFLHYGLFGRVQSKECYFRFTYTSLAVFCCCCCFCFSSKNLCFYHFYFFFNEVSSFRNRILTNQKPELAIRNFQ